MRTRKTSEISGPCAPAAGPVCSAPCSPSASWSVAAVAEAGEPGAAAGAGVSKATASEGPAAASGHGSASPKRR